jgi:hypothetical protein
MLDVVCTLTYFVPLDLHRIALVRGSSLQDIFLSQGKWPHLRARDAVGGFERVVNGGETRLSATHAHGRSCAFVLGPTRSVLIMVVPVTTSRACRVKHHQVVK